MEGLHSSQKQTCVFVCVCVFVRSGFGISGILDLHYSPHVSPTLMSEGFAKNLCTAGWDAPLTSGG